MIRKQSGDWLLSTAQKSITRKLGNSGAQSSSLSDSWEIVGAARLVEFKLLPVSITTTVWEAPKLRS